MPNPFDINREFEAAIGEYTGAPYVVTTNSCTMALFLALRWEYERRHRDKWAEIPYAVSIPKRTYVSVPMQILNAGFRLQFRDEGWSGAYRLEPLPIWDSARHFTAGLFNHVYEEGSKFVCCSFHSTKTLGIKREKPIDPFTSFAARGEPWDIEQGGCILHNDPEADKWCRKARFDGRTEGVAPKDDTFSMLGYHCYMNPSTARLGLELLTKLPKNNPPLPNDDYPDLSLAPIFRGRPFTQEA